MTDVDQRVAGKLIDILSEWTEATGRYTTDHRIYEGSQLDCLEKGKKQVSGMLRFVKKGDYEKAERAYGGACSNFYDAGYDWETRIDQYTLNDLSRAYSIIRRIAGGEDVEIDVFQ